MKKKKGEKSRYHDFTEKKKKKNLKIIFLRNTK